MSDSLPRTTLPNQWLHRKSLCPPAGGLSACLRRFLVICDRIRQLWVSWSPTRGSQQRSTHPLHCQCPFRRKTPRPQRLEWPGLPKTSKTQVFSIKCVNRYTIKEAPSAATPALIKVKSTSTLRCKNYFNLVQFYRRTHSVCCTVTYILPWKPLPPFDTLENNMDKTGTPLSM